MQVNGRGWIIPYEVVSGGTSSVDKWNFGSSNIRTHGKVQKEDEYERFSRSRSIQDTSTPNHFDKDSKNAWKLDLKPAASKRPNNSSTVSLPNYNELEIVRCAVGTHSENRKPEAFPERPARKSTTGSLPLGTIFPYSKVLSFLHFSFFKNFSLLKLRILELEFMHKTPYKINRLNSGVRKIIISN